MSARAEAMREQGVFWCPEWCEQPDDEEQYEEHFGPWVGFETENGEWVVARKRRNWYEGLDDHLELTIRSDDGTAYLTLAEMNQMVTELLYGEEHEIENHEVKPAYEGAEEDEDEDGDDD